MERSEVPLRAEEPISPELPPEPWLVNSPDARPMLSRADVVDGTRAMRRQGAVAWFGAVVIGAMIAVMGLVFGDAAVLLVGILVAAAGAMSGYLITPAGLTRSYSRSDARSWNDL